MSPAAIGAWGAARLLTLDTALRNARYLHVLMRHSDKAEIACRSNMANSFCGAIIETSPAGPAQAAQLLRHATLRAPCAPRALARRAVGRRPGPLRLRIAEDGKTVVIFAVNSKTKPIDWTWQFDGFAGAPGAVRAEALCDTQDARQPDVMNHWSAPTGSRRPLSRCCPRRTRSCSRLSPWPRLTSRRSKFKIAPEHKDNNMTKTLLPFITAGALAASLHAAEFHVALSGRDANPGTDAAPLPHHSTRGRPGATGRCHHRPCRRLPRTHQPARAAANRTPSASSIRPRRARRSRSRDRKPSPTG